MFMDLEKFLSLAEFWGHTLNIRDVAAGPFRRAMLSSVPSTLGWKLPG